jgi:PAS domain S-box-containing protein
MADPAYSKGDRREVSRLADEVEQLRTALEAASDETAGLVEERDRLLRRVAAQARELQAAEAAYARDRPPEKTRPPAPLESEPDHEELRVAFEELQVLTEELEVANTALHETNQSLDQRVRTRTQELEAKNTALSDSERRFRTLVEGIPQLVWRAADGGYWTWSSPQWTTLTGLSAEESMDLGWLEAVHPEDRDRVRRAWSEAPGLGRLQVEHRVRRAVDGGYSWFQTHAMPVRGGGGRIVEWLGASTDVQDMRALQDRQGVLLHELQHRVRNTLAIVRSIASSTAETSETVEGFAAHLEGRLSALARTQVVLTRHPGSGVDLESLIRDELLAQAAREGCFDLDGPEVRLSPKASEVLSLAIHELATNAVKYGALAPQSGHVSIRWSTHRREDHETWLTLVWQETGVRVAAAAPRRSGFGTELIETRVPYELAGEGALRLYPGGLRCDIAFPLRGGASILQTDALP